MEYGSLVRVDKLEPMPEPPKDQLTLFDVSYDTKLNTWHFRRLLAQKYDVVVTNPPYINKKSMNEKLLSFLKSNYKNSSADIYAAFIERAYILSHNYGYIGLMTSYTWLSLSSFSDMRKYLVSNKDIVTLVQPEYHAMFEEAYVPICSFVLRNKQIGSYGIYIRLSDFYGAEIQSEKTLAAISNPECGYLYTKKTDAFLKVPGGTIAYWVGESLIHSFEIATPLGALAEPKLGLATTDNNKYLRLWYELIYSDIGFAIPNVEQAIESGLNWFPYNKGGEYRKWYGNNDYVVNYGNNGQEIKADVLKKYPYLKTPDFVVKNTQFYFRQSITWSKISSGDIAFRYKPTGNIFDIAGTSLFADEDFLQFIHGFCNSCVALAIANVLSPTLNYEVGHIASFPIIAERIDEVKSIVERNISLSRSDWDAFETSWDFTRHPLICGERRIAAAFANWEREAAERFDALKANEEELNRIFIDIYELQDELTPEVEVKDVTVRRADLSRDIRSLISYAVGCMFGRYSPDYEGLAYAGGEWDASKYRAFPADKDNILPICDDEYFDDDIASRFVAFIKTVYGADTLEENLKFIADALGGKGTPREIIRSYFLNSFYADHCKIYQKRPIYWLFDSGKKNGFKALIYMHRYSRDLLAKLRTDYVHEQQERYRTQLSHISVALNTATGAERARLLKQQDKLSEQAREIGAFEEKVHHLADQNISLDLDDGVKKNYEIFADVLANI